METSSRVLGESSERVLCLTRSFEAPREVVFHAWTDTEVLRRWIPPQGFEIIEVDAEFIPGGMWRACVKAPDGSIGCLGGMCREIISEQRLVFTHAWEDESDDPPRDTVVTITFSDSGPAKSQLGFCQGVFRTVEARNGHREGWNEIFNRLGAYLQRTAPR